MLKVQVEASQHLQAQYGWFRASTTAMSTATGRKARQEAGEKTSWEEKLSARCLCWGVGGGGVCVWISGARHASSGIAK